MDVYLSVTIPAAIDHYYDMYMHVFVMYKSNLRYCCRFAVYGFY